ncbi:unnamed protein product [Discula destructiva]
MPSRSSSPTRSFQAVFPSCFPRAEGTAAAQEARALPERPRRKDPILDPNSCIVPIRDFDDQTHRAIYAPRPDGIEADLPAEAPDGCFEQYLIPSLARNERLRLTMLWYHTNGLLEDEHLLGRLQAIVGLVQTFFQGWEYAIMGFVSEDSFTRVAAAGMRLAILPRRESPCSHTITQLESGKVFFIPDMDNDWRFRAAPISMQGLRGYAGAQLRCNIPGGESVALGSLCIASNSKQPSLTPTQQDALIRFADMLSAEVISHSREARRRQRHSMARLLAECRLDELEDAKDRILHVMHQVYPAACVDLVELGGDQIPLPAHEPIYLSDIDDGLWEDTEFIEELILNRNHQKLKTSRTVRAIVHPVQTYPAVRYLVVASTQIQTVFDDVDAWFVQNCATSLEKVVQERLYGEALMVKERFLRGITHQMRTPIHGVLASCDLLTEELSSRTLLGDCSQACGTTAFTILDAIRDSGKELMTTVNNMLKLNRWTETTINRKPACLQDWLQFEDDILLEVDQVNPDYDHSNVSIIFMNSLCEDKRTISVDIPLLKECIQSLVLNALQATKQGAVIIAIDAAPDRSYLEVDVMDTGHGIATADQERIFEAYEKVDIHSRGAGLGLTLARNIAKLMHGDVKLRSSQRGSHFRATVATPPPTGATPVENRVLHEDSANSKTLTFHRVHHEEQDSDVTFHFAKYLARRGFTETEISQESIALLPYVPDPAAFQKLVADNPAKMAICLAPTRATPLDDYQHDRVQIFSGPFTSTRLKEIFADICQMWESLQHTDLSIEPETLGHMTNCSSGLLATNASLDSLQTTDICPYILAVDDNMVNLKIMRMYCEKRGIEYATAINGREAVDRFRESLQQGRPLNLILMDLQMPVCDGADATQEIRDIERQQTGLSTCCAGTAPPPLPSRIFMVTGQDSLNDKARSFEAGADEFFVKPMGMKKLDQGIGQYFPSFRKTALK